MKKIIFSLVMGLLCLCQTNSYAQNNEFYFQYGVGSNLLWGDNIKGQYETVFEGDLEDIVAYSTGTIGAGYKGFVGNHLSIGVGGVYEKLFGEVNAYTAMGGIHIYYIHTNGFQLYSGASAGITLLTIETFVEDEYITVSGNKFAYQLTGLGFRLGNNVGLFAEAGFGGRGILNAGVSVKF